MQLARTILRFATSCALFALATGCGGGGSSGVAPMPVASAPGSGAPSSFGKSDASITVQIASRASARRAARSRKRFYVSAGTQGLIAAFAQGDTTTYQGFTLAPNAAATTASPATCGALTTTSYTCTLYLDLAPGSYTGTLTTYDAAQSGTTGTPAANGSEEAAVALSTATQSVAVAANTANAFAFTLHAIVEAFQSTPQYIGVPAAPASSPPTLSTTFSALDGDSDVVDSVDPNSTTTFYSGQQPSGPFSPISFAVSEVDGNTCNEPVPCTSLTSSAPSAVTDTATEGVSFLYTGQGSSGDGNANDPPYYGLIALADTTGYDGATSPASPVSGPYAATAFVVPFFGFVNTASANAAAVDATHVSFTSPSQSVTLDAVQYHLPDTSTGYTATLDNCASGSGGGSIATVSAPTPLAYGASFTLSAGSGSGTCTVTLSDGLAADNVTIDVTNSFTPPQLVQSSTGIGTVSLPNNVTAGDTLVLTISNFDQTSNNFPTSYGNFTYFAVAADSFTSFYLADVTASGPLASFDLGGPTTDGGTVYWIGEFSGTSSAAITAANSAINGQAGSSVTIVPNAADGLLLASSEEGENSSLPGYEQFTEDSTGLSEIQVELATTPTTDTTDPVTITFAGADADSESAIQIAPATFSGSQSMVRRRPFEPTALRRHLLRMRGR